ncbi:MAG: ABC transporter ATP-binding protein [Victivallaceae bacterium]|nr:ABC transporter ATP-binding protein [Victivallaceae bacterium]
MLVRVEHLWKSFRGVPALRDLSFELPPGKIFGFVGPNGAGKTTTLRIMAGLTRPDSGEVLFDGIAVTDYPEKAFADAGFMPDTLPEASDIEVWEYLDNFARAFGMPEAARAEAVRRVSEFTNLIGLGGKFLNELSKGMKQQVSLARVLLHDPALLLLDEPAAGLDPRARLELRNCLRRLAAAGKSIFISSHILSDLDDIADGVVILEKGRLVSAGERTLLQKEQEGHKSSVRVLLVFDAVFEAPPEALRQIGGIRAVKKVSARQWLLELEGAEEQFRMVMQEIFRSNLPVVGMSRPDLGLEEIFLQATKGEVQ